MFLTLALRAIVLIQAIQQIGKRNQLFPLTMEERKEFADLALALYHLMDKHDEEPLPEGIHRCQFYKYEMFDFVRAYLNQDEVEQVIPLMQRLGQGETLPTYKQVKEFLLHLNSAALAKHNQGACW